jgi:D-arabinose 5-phosphate isomerase GutQ
MGLKDRLKYQANTIAAVAERHTDHLEELLDACEATLRSNSKIVVSALGKNIPICEKFVGTLNSLGLAARFMHTNDAIHGDLGILQGGDLLIIVSKSGNTEESLRLAKEARRKPITTWALTCNDNSPLTKLTTRSTALHLHHEGDLWNLMPINSTLIFLAVFNAISIELASRLGLAAEVFLENHPSGRIGGKEKGVANAE